MDKIPVTNLVEYETLQRIMPVLLEAVTCIKCQNLLLTDHTDPLCNGSKAASESYLKLLEPMIIKCPECDQIVEKLGDYKLHMQQNCLVTCPDCEIRYKHIVTFGGESDHNCVLALK